MPFLILKRNSILKRTRMELLSCGFFGIENSNRLHMLKLLDAKMYFALFWLYFSSSNRFVSVYIKNFLLLLSLLLLWSLFVRNLKLWMYGIDDVTCYILQVVNRSSRGFGQRCGKYKKINMQAWNILLRIINIDTQILDSGFEHSDDDQFRRFTALYVKCVCCMLYVHRLVILPPFGNVFRVTYRTTLYLNFLCFHSSIQFYFNCTSAISSCVEHFSDYCTHHLAPNISCRKHAFTRLGNGKTKNSVKCLFIKIKNFCSSQSIFIKRWMPSTLE